MKDQHAHCGCEEDHADWRRGHYEPGESPEAEKALPKERRDHAVQPREQRKTKTRRHP